MKKPAKQCHRILHTAPNQPYNPRKAQYADLNALHFLPLSGAFKDIRRINYAVQELRLSLKPHSFNWNRCEFDNLFCSSGHVPCMFTGDWNRHWNVCEYYDSLCRSHSSAAVTVKIGQGDDAMDMEWNHFIEYMECDCLGHDEPLYVTDDDFHLRLPEFTQTYSVPAPFVWTLYHDVFSHVSDSDRPPYRWLVIGGWRTGSSLHTDPYCSSAWNVSLYGRKRWIVFPGEYLHAGSSDSKLHRILCGDKGWNGLYSPQPVLEWFMDEYLALVEYKNRENSHVFEHFYEFIQKPVDMVYIPKGWAHAVLNLDKTVAVTHNFTLKEDSEMVLSCWKKEMINQR